MLMFVFYHFIDDCQVNQLDVYYFSGYGEELTSCYAKDSICFRESCGSSDEHNSMHLIVSFAAIEYRFEHTTGLASLEEDYVLG